MDRTGCTETAHPFGTVGPMAKFTVFLRNGSNPQTVPVDGERIQYSSHTVVVLGDEGAHDVRFIAPMDQVSYIILAEAGE